MSFLAKIFGDAAGGIVTGVTDYLKARQEIKSKERTRKLELEEAIQARKVQLISQGLTADMNWEMEFAKQAESSWKDEYTLLVVSVPAVLAFVKVPFIDGPVIVTEGFQALAQTPLWYQGLLLSIFFATYGIRYWRRSQSDT